MCLRCGPPLGPLVEMALDRQGLVDELLVVLLAGGEGI